MAQPNEFAVLARRALAGAVLATAAAAQAADPFVVHERWTLSATPTSAWLPSGVAFAAGGELVWAAGQGAAPRALLLSTAGFAAPGIAPSFEAPLAAPFGAVGVAAESDEGALFTVAQYVVSDPSHRRTEIARYDARGDLAGSAFAPEWRHNMGLIGNGVAKLAAARDGTRVVCATHDAQFQVLDLEWLDSADGSVLSSRVAWSSTLRQLAASADLARVALVVGAELRIYADTASLVYAESLSSSSNALALSGDGRTLAVGSGAKLRLLTESGGSWQFAREWSAPAGEVVARVGLSDDGATLAAGWWNAQTAHSVRLELWNLATGVRVYERVLDAPGATLQDFVEAALVSRDGRRAAFGLWGTGDAAPELVLVDRDSASELLAVDLGGSVRALALDATGTRVAAGFKHVHANQFGTTGAVRVFDTGERDLQLLEEARVGGVLHVAARVPGARRMLFLIGTPAPPVPFAGGSLSLARHGLLRLGRAADSSGRADLLWPLSPAPGPYDLAVQAVGHVPGVGLRVTRTLVEPVVF